MLWFSDLDRATAFGYGGQKAGQNEITSRNLMQMQGQVASPAQLQRDIVDLGHRVDNLKYVVGVFATIAVSLSVGLIVGLLVTFLRGTAPAAPPPQHMQEHLSTSRVPTASPSQPPNAGETSEASSQRLPTNTGNAAIHSQTCTIGQDPLGPCPPEG